MQKRFLQWAKLAIWDSIPKKSSLVAAPEVIIIDASFIKLHQHDSGVKEGYSARSDFEVFL
jgi:hypothetical protein